MNECTHMVTDNRIGPNFGKPLIHRECSKSYATLHEEVVELREKVMLMRNRMPDDVSPRDYATQKELDAWQAEEDAWFAELDKEKQ